MGSYNTADSVVRDKRDKIGHEISRTIHAVLYGITSRLRTSAMTVTQPQTTPALA